MNPWLKFLKQLRETYAYDGDDTLAAVKAFIAENNIEIKEGDSEDALDIDALYAQKDAKPNKGKADADPDGGDAAEQDDRAPGVKRVLRVNAALHDDDHGVSPKVHRLHMARKAYNARAARGETRFSCADEAELMGAYFRQLVATFTGKSYGQAANDRDIIGKNSTIANNLSAGVLVPEELLDGVMYATEQYGVARKLANVQRMSRDVVTRRRKTAIVAMSHLGETGRIAVDDNEYDMVTLTAKKVGVMLRASNELFEDAAVSVGDEFANSVAEAQAYREDLDYFLGNGTSAYGGHVGLIAALPSSAYIDASGDTWAEITNADFTKLIGSVENVSNGRLAFVCSRQFYFQVMLNLDIAANQYKSLLTGNQGNADAVFLGYPVYFSQVLPRASAPATKSCYFGDFMGASMLGDRRDLRVESSRDFYFDSDETAIRATARYAVNIHGDGRGSTYGPVVCLVTAAQ